MIVLNKFELHMYACIMFIAREEANYKEEWPMKLVNMLMNIFKVFVVTGVRIY